MLKLYTLLCFITLGTANAQPPELKLQSNGFEQVDITIPATKNDKLVALTRSWVAELEHRGPDQGKGYDITNVTDNSITVSGYKKNGFYFRDRGEQFMHKIRYTMKITFYESHYTVDFKVMQIFTDNDVPVKYSIPDYFLPDGKLKDGYTELDSSLENTVNNLILSHYNFILNFR